MRLRAAGSRGLRRRRRAGLGSTAFMGCVLALTSVVSTAEEEIASFRLTDINGYLAVGYLLDEFQSDGSFARSPQWREALHIRTRSYFYHPALLEMIIEGGPTLVQYDYESNTGNSKGEDTVLSFGAQFNFLNRKLYPFSVYYRLEHPNVATGSLGQIQAKTNEYGVRGVLFQPLLPMQVNWNLSHRESDGAGFESLVDQEVDQAALSASMGYMEKQNIRLNVDWSEAQSRSGNIGLPIQESLIEVLSSRLTGTNKFGDENQVQLNQQLIWLSQDTETDRKVEVDNFTYSGGLRWENSDRLNTYANYRFRDNQRTETWARTQALNVGASLTPGNNFYFNGGAGFSSADDPGYSRTRTNLQLSGQYRQQLSIGKLSFSGGVSASRSDEVSSAASAFVFDEALVMEGTIPVALNEEFVIVESVIVTNALQTQTFAEGLDYRLVTIGSTTSIERIVTGNIVDGQDVLASYSYETRGTVKYKSRSESLSADLQLKKYARLFVRLSEGTNDILGGEASTTLNDTRVIEVGTDINVPLMKGWSIGGEYRHRDRDETISPAVSETYQLYVQSGTFWRTQARFSVLRNLIEQEVSEEDSDATRYVMNVSSRLPGGLLLTYNGAQGEDVGGTRPIEDRRHSLRLDWRYRAVRMSLRADRSDVRRVEGRRVDSRISVNFRRFF